MRELWAGTHMHWAVHWLLCCFSAPPGRPQARYFGHVTDNRGSAIPVGTSMLLQLTYPVDLRGLPLDREERIFEYAHDRAAGGVGDSFVSHDASNVTWISGTSWIGTRAVR